MGSVTAEGLVEVDGQVDGELHCTSLIISRGAYVAGTIAAGRVVVDGRVEGPIQDGDVILKSQAHVVGDIHHQSLSIESGAFFDGRSVHARANGQATERVEKSPSSKQGTRASLARPSPQRSGPERRRKTASSVNLFGLSALLAHAVSGGSERPAAPKAYFFEHFLVVSSHIILAFSHAAFVVGIFAAANAGAANATTRPK